MNDAELRQMLATADSAHAPRAVDAPSVERLATQWRRRQRRRVALTTLLPVLIVAVVYVWRSGRDGVHVNENIPFAKATVDSGSSLPIVDGPSVAKVDPQALQQELAALDREAELSLATARRLQQARSRVANAPFPTPSPGWSLDATVREQRDRAAMVAVLNADRMRTTGGRASAAEEDYRGVIERFPDCDWSAVARTRLTESQQMN